MGEEYHLLEHISWDMKRDWNHRASRNAKWYINTAGANQSEDEFDSSGEQEVKLLVLEDLDILTAGRDPSTLRILEIGSGIGRMTRFLADIFGEVHAVDVSGEMIARAKCRLRGASNVFLRETNGFDFKTFQSDFFDVIFSAYVFQHVPDKTVIQSNLQDAYRVLRPGGIFKFQTNGVDNPAYDSTAKDTWAGDTFSEPEIRSLAKRLGAGFLSISGIGTQYCWTIWRKPEMSAAIPPQAGEPRILTVRQQGDDRDDEALDHLVILVDLLDGNALDTNILTIRVREVDLVPYYVGLERNVVPEAKSNNIARIEALLPHDIGTGNVPVRLFLLGKEIAGPLTIELKRPIKRKPRIVAINNAADGGLDIHALGSKAHARIFLEGLEETDGYEVLVLLGEQTVETQSSFVPGSGHHMVQLPIPAGTPCGEIPVRVKVGDFVTGEKLMHIREGADPAEGFPHMAIKKVKRFIFRFLRKKN